MAGDRIEKAIDIADQEIGRIPWIGQGRGRGFYAVGGTWRAIARLHMEETDYPLHVMHGYTMPTRAVIDFCEAIRKAKKLSTFKGIEDIARPRREVLPYGALVLERLLGKLAPDAVHFSVFGIREGLVYGLLSEAERRKDPLLTFCTEYAQLRSRSPEHGEELFAWSSALFEGRAPGRPRRSAGCATPPACCPTSAGAPTPTTAASRA